MLKSIARYDDVDIWVSYGQSHLSWGLSDWSIRYYCDGPIRGMNMLVKASTCRHDNLIMHHVPSLRVQ